MARLKAVPFHEDRAAAPSSEPPNAQGNDNERTPHKPDDIYYRQVLQPGSMPTSGPAPPGLPIEPQAATSSSSYDYWWPYPPGGITATTSTTPNAGFAAPTSLGVLQSLQPISSAMSNIPFSSTLALSAEPLLVSSVDTSTMDSSMTSSRATITISSEPQTSTPTLVVYPKSQSQGLKPSTYLIPIFVILGVILGCFTAWVGWGCITRKPRVYDFNEDDVTNRTRGRRRPRRSELEVGPAYCPSVSDKAISSEGSSVHEKTALAPAAAGEVFSWRGLDIGGGKDASEKDSERVYLVPPTSAPFKSNSRTKSVVSRSARGLSRAATGRTAASMSVYSQVDDDEYEDEDEHRGTGRNGDDGISFLDEFESDFDPRSPRLSDSRKSQQKSAPNSTTTPDTGRVVSVSRRRPKQHNRQESDLRLEDVTQGRSGDHGRARDLRRNTTTRTERSTLTVSSAQTGFRMIEGSPLPTPATSPEANVGNSGGFFWSKSIFGNSTSSADRYTALPSRKSHSGSRSRSSSPVKNSRSSPSKRGPRSRAGSKDQHPLPNSPPLVTSPKLEHSLCFTPVLGGGE